MMKFMFMYLFSLWMLLFIKLNYIYFNLYFISSFMFLFLFKSNSGFTIFSEYLGLDNYSYPLVLMTIWIIGLMIMSLNDFDSLKIFSFMVMAIILVLFFSSLNLMLLYLFFELSLIPTYFMIIFWGSNPERLSASFYLLIYMLLISLPLLFYIMKMFDGRGTLGMLSLMYWTHAISGWWSYLLVIGAFLIKLPVYIFHLWLPKAHVEAPVYGSMILAAVLLKLGGYGLYRMVSMIKMDLSNHELIISVGLVGGLLVSFLSMLQVDMKSLVAYSSVVHMNLMLAGLLTLSTMGVVSSLLIMVSHGICSSGMFYMVNMYYERTSSRLLILNKGMINYLPVMTLWWFLLCSSNFSFPLSLNFLGEITLLMSVLSWDLNLSLIMVIACFFSGAYSIYLFSYVQHGSSVVLNSVYSSVIKEFLMVNLHYFPLLLILINLFMFY